MHTSLAQSTTDTVSARLRAEDATEFTKLSALLDTWKRNTDTLKMLIGVPDNSRRTMVIDLANRCLDNDTLGDNVLEEVLTALIAAENVLVTIKVLTGCRHAFKAILVTEDRLKTLRRQAELDIVNSANLVQPSQSIVACSGGLPTCGRRRR